MQRKFGQPLLFVFYFSIETPKDLRRHSCQYKSGHLYMWPYMCKTNDVIYRLMMTKTELAFGFWSWTPISSIINIKIIVNSWNHFSHAIMITSRTYQNLIKVFDLKKEVKYDLNLNGRKEYWRGWVLHIEKFGIPFPHPGSHLL